ncbi:MAG: DUF3352 domain-containing protein [Chloroflexota bacterium]|nr:MAG: DUF3352 domain-containing protein [Chloroflexota bacterium]
MTVEARPDETQGSAPQAWSGPDSTVPAPTDPVLGGPEPETLAADGPAAVLEPIAATPAGTAPGASRGRWLIGGGLAVAAIAAIALAASFLAASPLPDVLKYLPADSAVVVELRPELPGDQRQHLGNLLAHFPGFEDQSTLDAKIDELLERITSESTGGQIDYATRVKPLLAGPMAVSVTADALTGMMAGGGADGFLFVATTDGSATCASIFGSTDDADEHREVEIVLIAGDVGCALHERHLLVGALASIRDAIDARLDAEGVDTNKTYREARSKLEGDQVASVYLDMDPLYDALVDASGPLGVEMPRIPEGFWTIGGIRVIDDALIFDTYQPVDRSTLPSDAPTSAPAAESRFASALPADTLGYLELHGLGASIEQTLGVLRSEPSMLEALGGLEDALGMLGGTANLTGWMEDLGIAVLPTDDALGAVILIRGTDAEVAAARLGQIRNLLVLGSTGTDITVRDSDHGGVTVTTVDLGDVSSLLGSMGVPGADLGRVELAFAVRGDLVIIGGGGGLVERILDVEAGTSLATSGTYDRVIEVAGAKNDVQLFVALDASLALAERFLPSTELELWTTELKPYLDHLAGAGMTSITSKTAGHSRIVITVK